MSNACVGFAANGRCIADAALNEEERAALLLIERFLRVADDPRVRKQLRDRMREIRKEYRQKRSALAWCLF